MWINRSTGNENNKESTRYQLPPRNTSGATCADRIHSPEKETMVRAALLLQQLEYGRDNFGVRGKLYGKTRLTLSSTVRWGRPCLDGHCSVCPLGFHRAVVPRVAEAPLKASIGTLDKVGETKLQYKGRQIHKHRPHVCQSNARAVSMSRTAAFQENLHAGAPLPIRHATPIQGELIA